MDCLFALLIVSFHAKVFNFLFFPHHVAWGILVPQPRVKSASPLRWKCRALTTGLPRKSQKFLILMKLVDFFLVFCAFDVMSKKSLLSAVLWSFSSKNFMALALKFRPLIYFELIFIYSIRDFILQNDMNQGCCHWGRQELIIYSFPFPWWTITLFWLSTNSVLTVFSRMLTLPACYILNCLRTME